MISNLYQSCLNLVLVLLLSTFVDFDAFQISSIIMLCRPFATLFEITYDYDHITYCAHADPSIYVSVSSLHSY
jgi:hypothetical protein